MASVGLTNKPSTNCKHHLQFRLTEQIWAFEKVLYISFSSGCSSGLTNNKCPAERKAVERWAQSLKPKLLTHAWNKYYIVVTNSQGATPTEILTKLNLTGYQPVGKANFHQTNKSYDLFIGTYKDKLVVANPDLTYGFFAAEPSDIERKFVAAFPTSEIAALAENSTVDEFGYTIINNGQRIRVKHGCDGEIYTDIGDSLAEEQAILTGHIFDPEELDEMREDMDEDEVQNTVAFEASWRAPAEISKRYFGDRIDNLDTDAIKLTRYKKV